MSIYIHFPFCRSKCIYCNFYSVTTTELKRPFIDALLKEISHRKKYLDHKKITTLYFGGGTPSLFTYEELSKIVDQLSSHFDLSHLVEFTFEANPEQLTPEYLSQLKRLGINRLSIGIQSFSNEILKLLHRSHSAQTAVDAIENAVNAGFGNLSIDLIYGIDARSAEDWKRELTTALSFPVTHLSAYALTIEENSLLDKKSRKGDRIYTTEDSVIRDFTILSEITNNAGFEQYEISNFAKNGRVSKHNSAYWEGVPYLGLGPGAHSYNRTSRQWNLSDIHKYICSIKSNDLSFEIEQLTQQMKFNEYVLLSLRTSKGLDTDHVKKAFGKENLIRLHDIFNKINASFYTLENNKYILTKEGILYADNIAEKLFI